MKKACILMLVLAVCLGMTGCQSQKQLLDPRRPVTLTMWHNFGGDMQKTMDTLIDEFNSTIGKEQGIIINVTAITSSAELQETLGMIANEDPGAPNMPDITTSYPKTAVLFQNKGLLANLETYFTEEELNQYVSAFIEEGRFGDGGLYVFPFAKSTEILYVNQTLFDRFAAECQVSMDCFATIEGIAKAAQRYYEWTDSQTPSTEHDGKQFFASDSWGNVALTAMWQSGTKLYSDETMNLTTSEYEQLFTTCYVPSVTGGFAIYDGYSSDLSKTGDLVCSTGSSAGILFYGDTITYPDNTTEAVEYSILPYPVTKGGQKIALQRGNGFIVAAHGEEKEYASSVFLKWFTEAKQNMRFVASTGYLPVTKEAFEVQMPVQMEQVEDKRICKMLTAVMEMYEEYSFYTAPVFETYDQIHKAYEKNYKSWMVKEQQRWQEENTELTDTQINEAFKDFLSLVK